MSVPTLKIAHRCRLRSATSLLTVTLGLVLLAVPQKAMAQIVPVCDRTPEVRDAIVEKIPDVSDCSEVTEAHLAVITGFLDLAGPHEFWGVPSGRPNPIPELKAGDFSGLSSLEGLLLQYNDLTTLPPGFFHGLSSLKTLNLENNRLTTLSTGVFAGLSSLRTLALSGNPLTTVPAGIFYGLTALDKLRLSLHYDELTPFHGGIFSGLTVLNTLYLTLSGFNDPVPLSGDLFYGLTALKSLNLYSLNRSTLPDDFFSELSTLKGLKLLGNRLTTLPAGIFAGLSSLESLDLNFNPLTSLPPGVFSGLSLLKTLKLVGNELSTLPVGVFAGLPSLETLEMDENRLATLPPGVFSGLSSLKTLNLGVNDLTTLPVGVFAGLPSLQWLYLYRNELTALPVGIFSGLSSLKLLNLRGNDLIQVSIGLFSGLSSLQTLDLAYNRLTALPDGIFFGLSSLQLLYLDRNELTTLPGAVFSGLSSLETLSLRGNELTTLPDRVFSGLTSLQTLVLTTNRLTALPDGIFTGLPSLKRLTVSQNERLLTTMISLEFAGEGRFRAMAQTGALFDIELPITVVNGVIDGGSSQQITIPRGSVYSATFTVSRNPGPASTVFVDIGELPEMPSSIDTDLTLVKSPHLPLIVLEEPNLHFAHFANGESITSELVLVNVGDEPIRPVISFLDRGGNLLSGGWLVEMREGLEVQEDGSVRVQTSVEPLGELTISTHPRRVMVSGSVRVVSDGPIGGVLRYVNPGIGVAGVGASPRVRDAIFPARNQAGGIRTAVAIRNRGAGWMRVRCQLMQAGAVLDETEISLKGGGQAARFLDELFTQTDTSDFVGSVRCTAPRSRLFTGVAVEMDTENRIFTTLPMVPVEPLADGSGEGTLVFAHFGNGSSIRSELVLVNVGTDPIRPSVFFYDRQGAQIDAESVVEVMGDLEVREDGALGVGTEMGALSELTISTHRQGELVTGSVRVESDGPMGGVLRFDVPSVGVAGIGASPPVTAAIFPARRHENGINTGAAIHNLEAEAMTLTCALMQNGRMLAETEIDLDAGGQVARFINELFKDADTFNFAGSVHCTAPPGGAFTGVALEMDADNRIFTTLPMVPVHR